MTFGIKLLEKAEKNAIYVFTVVFLAVAVLIIFCFNYYISVAKDYNFKKRFFEMAGISLGVAAISFFIGVLIKRYIGIDI